ncbi:MAG: PilT/PilU family type 4a pilus ATPase [Lachnospiraceae bacterium]|nr:PilT/PilU family type 4a pilus ATPase [Lachnospiraceae bacterium]
MTLQELIANARKDNCSDLHITAGTEVAVRRYGVLHVLDILPTLEEAEGMILSLLSNEEIEYVRAGNDLDVALTDETDGRLRINVYHQRNHLAASIRLLEKEIPTFDELGIGNILGTFADLRSGLVLVTGPTGSGKSTTLASMVEYINANQSRHVITIEDPIEYVFKHKKAMIHQRQIGIDARDFTSALRSSLREDPDVIMVGEMRDFETISAAITAAETGHLVLSTLHTKSAAQTVERIISSCPVEVRGTILHQFTNILSGVVTQELVPRADGNGRVAATEIMVNTKAISNLIKEQKTNQITTALQSGKILGMHTMNADLVNLVKKKVITKQAAMAHTNDKAELEKMI